MTTIEKIARAILKRRYYDCEPDMWGRDIELFYAQVDPDHVLDARDEAIAAVKAMREDIDVRHLEAMHQAMFANPWDAPDTPMIGAGFDAALDSILAEAEGEGK